MGMCLFHHINHRFTQNIQGQYSLKYNLILRLKMPICNFIEMELLKENNVKKRKKSVKHVCWDKFTNFQHI